MAVASSSSVALYLRKLRLRPRQLSHVHHLARVSRILKYSCLLPISTCAADGCVALGCLAARQADDSGLQLRGDTLLSPRSPTIASGELPELPATLTAPQRCPQLRQSRLSVVRPILKSPMLRGSNG